FPQRRRLDLPGAARHAGVRARLAGGACAGVFHGAAWARGAAAERAPQAAFAVNCTWPGALAGAQRGPFFHVSTDLVFGAAPPPADGFGPAAATAPLGTYGATKAAGEFAVRAASRCAHVVRLPLLFGDSRGRGLGASDGLLAALERGEQPRLFTDEFRTPIDVRAAAEALVQLADLHSEPEPSAASGQTWHIAGRRLSRLDLGRALCHAHGVDPGALVPTTRAALGLAATRAADTSLDARATRNLSAQLARTLDSGSAPPFP
ncbi:MAG: sugar nucleotide-binding protein, partial [Planctomycetota bacterium]|nr:sugar nucleotide-binding protein [Planctomycetota bacterium]